MSVRGTKNILKSTLNSLDVNDLYSLKVDYRKLVIKNKTKKILEKIKSLKRNG